MAGPASPVVRVLLVDDQPQFRRAAAMLIGATDGLALAGEAASGEEGGLGWCGLRLRSSG